MKNQSIQLANALFLVILITGVVAWGMTSCIKRDIEENKQRIIDNQNKTLQSLQHPEIVGTNEVGEVVKRYYVYDNYYRTAIYEVGRTKTEVIHKGKAGTTTNVSVEEQ